MYYSNIQYINLKGLILYSKLFFLFSSSLLCSIPLFILVKDGQELFQQIFIDMKRLLLKYFGITYKGFEDDGDL